MFNAVHKKYVRFFLHFTMNKVYHKLNKKNLSTSNVCWYFLIIKNQHTVKDRVFNANKFN